VTILYPDTQKIEFGNNQPKGVAHDLHQNHGAIRRIMQIVLGERRMLSSWCVFAAL
jgi:hypothetical protein